MEKEYEHLLRISRELDIAMSTSVRINHDQVAELVVADLLRKYEGNKSNEWGPRFKEILRFYLTDDELETLLSEDV